MADALRGSMDAAEYKHVVLANPPFNVSDWGGERLADDDIARAYHAWHDGADAYEDLPGFCKSASLDEVRRRGHVATPGRYVGAEPQPDDGEPFEAKMRQLVGELQAQQAEGARLNAAVAENLKALGFGVEE